MNLIIYLSTSKNKNCKKIADGIEGKKVRINIKGYNPKTRFMQMFWFGYQTTNNKPVKYEIEPINFNEYKDIYLISPVWAGNVAQHMKQFLLENKIENKNIHIISSCDGGYKKYFDRFKKLLHPSNKVVEETMYLNNLKEKIKNKV